MKTREYYIDEIRRMLNEVDDTDELRTILERIYLLMEFDEGPYGLLLQLLETLRDRPEKIRQILSFVKGKLG